MLSCSKEVVAWSRLEDTVMINVTALLKLSLVRYSLIEKGNRFPSFGYQEKGISIL